MNYSNKNIVNELQSKLENTNIEDYNIAYLDIDKALILGSFDFSYYHNIEIVLYEVSFICCPTTTFTINQIRIANKEEISSLDWIMHGIQNEGDVIALDDTFSNISYYIVAQSIEYNYEVVKYFNEGKLIKGALSDWAKMKFFRS